MPDKRKRSARGRGSGFNVLSVDGTGFKVIQCTYCTQRLTGFRTVETARRNHWPNRAYGQPCNGYPQPGPPQPAPQPPLVNPAPEYHQDPAIELHGSDSPEQRHLGERDVEEGGVQEHPGPEPAGWTPHTFVGREIAKTFGNVRYYGRILGIVGELVLQGSIITEQWRVCYEDGQEEDFTREERDKHIEEYRYEAV